jgi:16S rRNA (cytidine1402-2'-O)-methyltransferase
VPRLYVVPTPIGNLEDLTLRALRVLREVSLILAEDTRHSGKLLRHYGIKSPLLSYHQHNKRARLDASLRALAEGDVALVSSAGTPSVSDPGFELINAAYDAGFEVDVLPGPNAAVTAVVAAALPAPGFLFMGFLPRRAPERRQRLAEAVDLPYALVLYEAPHRLRALLEDVREVMGNRRMAVARELTKVHQEVVRGSVEEMIERHGGAEPRGEFTLVVAPAEAGTVDRREDARQELGRRRARGEEARTAVAEVAAKYGLKRNDAYRLWLENGR